MKLKSKWVYNYKKGLKGPMVSTDYHIIDNKLFFVLNLGISALDSVLLELDLGTQNVRVVFEEDHVMRSAGIYEDGKFYLTTFKGVAYCINLDGSIKWSTALNLTNASFEVALDGDKLYVSDYSIYCLDKNTGNILWKNDTFKEKNSCNILYDEKNIYGGELDGSVFCIDKLSGEINWSYGKNEWISNCALLDQNRLLVNHIHGKFYIIDAAKGELLCTHKAKGYLYRKPAFENSRMYIGDANDVIHSKSGNMTCYEITSQNDMEEIFSVNVGGGISTKAVIDGIRLFFAAEDNYLYCIDKNTGEELMPRKKTKGICRNIIVREDELILLSDKGQIECFEISGS